MRNLLKIVPLILILIQFIFSNEKIYRDNTLLFSLWKENPLLSIDDQFLRTNNLELNNILSNYNIIKIEPWLKSATENDFNGDIYLNRIYRITIDENFKSNISQISAALKNITIIEHIERENIHKVFPKNHNMTNDI